MKDLYAALGVTKSASADDIRRAYRKLAREHHPDVNPGDKASEDRFKEISAAYDVLSDDKKRKAYDEFGEDSLKGGFDPDKARAYSQWRNTRQQGGSPFEREVVDFDLGDLADLFGGRARAGRGGGGPGFGGFGGYGRGPMKGQDVRAHVDLDFRQAIDGLEVSVGVPSSSGTEQVKVRIPPGADHKSTLRVAGKGAPGPGGGPRGDLVIETRVKPHPHIRREGLDLHMTLPVTLAEAYAGAQVDVPTFDGPVKVRVPPRSQSGQRLRLKEKGVARKKKRGDLYLELAVRVPQVEDAELATALEKANALYERPVREEVTL